MILSQAAMEHVEDLDETYLLMKKLLKDSGFISHQIDFKSHGVTHSWDGHWTLSQNIIKILKGKDKFLINRMPCSKHINILDEYNFKHINVTRYFSEPTFARDKLSPQFFLMTNLDRRTSGAFINAIK